MISARPTILIADDHRPMAKAVAMFLAHEFDVIGTVFDGESLIEEVDRLTPDVLLVDISMPGISGIDAVRRLTDAGCTAAIVMLTLYEDPDLVARALGAGARGYVSKSRLKPDLISAIRAVLEGGTFVTCL